MGLFGDIFDEVGGWIGIGEKAEKRKQEQANLDYQKHLNQVTMEREDTAVQRRVADLKAAGLSKTLAAGSPASSASFRSGETPQTELMDAVAAQAQISQARAQVAQTKAQAELIKAQKAIVEHDYGVIKDRPNTLSTDPWQARFLDQGKTKLDKNPNHKTIGSKLKQGVSFGLWK